MNLIHYLDQPIVKKHLLISGVGFILGVLLYLYFKGEAQHVLELILSGAFGIIIGYLCYFISVRLDRVLPWKSQLPSRFLSGISLHFILTFALVLLMVYVYNSLFVAATAPAEFAEQIDGTLNEEYDSFYIKLGTILFIIVLLFNVVYFALYSYTNYAKGQIDEIAYERKQIDLQLKALKSQLSAHFLFNNLNTISSLAYKDTAHAEAYIRGLGTIYNYTLNSYTNRLVDLSDELKCVTSYLNHVRTRFGNMLNFKIDISDSLVHSKVPPLTLQMLVENAVKHNQIDQDNALELNISANGNNIVITNNITKAPKSVKSFNVGLKNIEARYQLISGKKIEITKDADFTVKIPIIKA